MPKELVLVIEDIYCWPLMHIGDDILDSIWVRVLHSHHKNHSKYLKYILKHFTYSKTFLTTPFLIQSPFKLQDCSSSKSLFKTQVITCIISEGKLQLFLNLLKIYFASSRSLENSRLLHIVIYYFSFYLCLYIIHHHM